MERMKVVQHIFGDQPKWRVYFEGKATGVIRKLGNGRFDYLPFADMVPGDEFETFGEVLESFFFPGEPVEYREALQTTNLAERAAELATA